MTSSRSEPRHRLVEAFNHLTLGLTRGKPRLADVVAKAGVARSTLYDHFGGRDDLLLEAIKAPLAAMAEVGAGTGDPQSLAKMLAHFKGRREDAIELFNGPLQRRVVRVAATMMCERDDQLAEKAAIHLADLLFGFVRLWLSGETAYSADTLATLMIRSAEAQHEVLVGASA